ncbi:MAG: crossover junction endodeoxyribonuclease RuvC [Bacillota bacterium]
MSFTLTAIVSLDPASYVSGYAVKRGAELEYGEIVLSPKASLQERLWQFYTKVVELIQRSGAKVVVCEDQFGHKNLNTFKLLCIFRGAAMLAAAFCGAEFCLFPPARVKLIVAGKGNASKKQVEDAVKRFYNIRDTLTHNESDAIALIYAWEAEHAS